MEGFTKVGEWFCKLDLPDPRSEWRRILSCVLFVALLAIVLAALLMVTP